MIMHACTTPQTPPCDTPPHACSNVSVDEDAGRALFYVFVEREADAATAPIILWLNGCVGSVSAVSVGVGVWR
jgi:hypothetical protein